MGFAGYESNVSRIALLKVKIVTKIKQQFSIIESERLKVFINYLRVFPRVPPMFIFSLHIFFLFLGERSVFHYVTLESLVAVSVFFSSSL